MHPDAEAALPDASLEFLVTAAQQLKAQNIFEFGSGRSTKALLAAGFGVTSLEHASYWMEQTRKVLTPDEEQRHTPLVAALHTRFQREVPFRNWRFDAALVSRLQVADLILIDAPYHVSFREATLCKTLNHTVGIPIVLDDTGLRTIRRFCDRIAAQNSHILHARSQVGHGFDCFARTNGNIIQNRAGFIEIAKAWRRYFQGFRR